jgi:TPR repeat protein
MKYALVGIFVLLSQSAVAQTEDRVDERSRSSSAPLNESGADSLQSQPPADQGARADPTDIEEIVVKGRRFRERPDALSMFDVRDDHAKGGMLYRQRRYAEAFPYLMNAAKRGFKVSQARVGFIYQQGLGGVPRNGAAAIGWIGVAASRKASPEIINYYRGMRENVPPTREAEIDEIVTRYVSQYGPAATGVRCDNTRVAGSHISTLRCDHEAEYDSRDILDTQTIFGVSTFDTNPLLLGP